jgi:hypothetical protein
MTKNKIKLFNVLYDVNALPSKITKILDNIKEDDIGTLLQKTLFNINGKCRNLIDVANRILPTCSDAKKYSASQCGKKLVKSNILRVFLLSDNKDIQAYST